jgi:hypothetical protein
MYLARGEQRLQFSFYVFHFLRGEDRPESWDAGAFNVKIRCCCVVDGTSYIRAVKVNIWFSPSLEVLTDGV